MYILCRKKIQNNNNSGDTIEKCIERKLCKLQLTFYLKQEASSFPPKIVHLHTVSLTTKYYY